MFHLSSSSAATNETSDSINSINPALTKPRRVKRFALIRIAKRRDQRGRHRHHAFFRFARSECQTDVPNGISVSAIGIPMYGT